MDSAALEAADAEFHVAPRAASADSQLGTGGHESDPLCAAAPLRCRPSLTPSSLAASAPPTSPPSRAQAMADAKGSPNPPLVDPLVRRVPVGLVAAPLRCGLCSDVLIEATTATECLHSFCRRVGGGMIRHSSVGGRPSHLSAPDPVRPHFTIHPLSPPSQPSRKGVHRRASRRPGA